MTKHTIFLLAAAGIMLLCITGLTPQAEAQPSSTVSENEPNADPDTLRVLPTVTISAPRFRISKDQLPRQVDVIGEHEINMTSGNEFTDVLKKNSAIDVVQYPSLLAGVGIRGHRPQTSGLNQKTQITVNGRPAGGTNLATMNLSGTDQIEVIKGPASALYGSQAMGGVVNIVPRKSTDELGMSTSIEYGSFNTVKADIQSGGRITNNLDFDLAFDYFNRENDYRLGDNNLFGDALGNEQATHIFSGGDSTSTVEDRQGDGDVRPFTQFSKYSGNLRLGYRINEQLRIDVSGEGFFADNVERPGDIFFGSSAQNLKDEARYSGDISVEYLLDNHEITLQAYAANENTQHTTLNEFDWFAGEYEPVEEPYLSFERGYQWQGIQLQDNMSLNNHNVTLGLDYNRASTWSKSWDDPDTRSAPFSPDYAINTGAAYAQGLLTFVNDNLIINPGVRLDLITFDVKDTPYIEDLHTDRETNPFLSPSLGAKYFITDALNIHSSIGRGFVTPESFNVAGFWEDPGEPGNVALTEGNPDLTNENSITWDAGVGYQSVSTGFEADLTYFSTQVQDRITTETTIPEETQLTAEGDTITSVTTYVNADEAETRGLEFETAYDFGALAGYRYSLRLFARGTSILNAEEITVQENGEDSREQIHNVADLTLNYGLEYNNAEWLSARLSGRYVGHRRDTDWNHPERPVVEYPRFMVMDFVTTYTFRDSHSLSLYVNNLTDENYYEKRGFNMPGRNFGLRYRLNL